MTTAELPVVTSPAGRRIIAAAEQAGFSIIYDTGPYRGALKVNLMGPKHTSFPYGWFEMGAKTGRVIRGKLWTGASSCQSFDMGRVADDMVRAIRALPTEET